MTLSRRDIDIVRALTTRVRLLTVEQVAAGWWPGAREGREQAARRLRELCTVRLLEERPILAEPFIALSQPIVVWIPGDQEPDHHSTAWQLQRRWTETARQTLVFIATSFAADTLGGVAPRLPTLGQETHDLHVSEVYLRLRRERPELADRWLGEEIVRPTRIDEKLPDALIVDAQGHPARVIEFGGRYDHKRVCAFHEDCAARGLPYELW